MRFVRRMLIKSRGGEKGQATIEYVLMLSTIVVLISAFLTAFHKDIIRFLFTFIGQILTT